VDWTGAALTSRSRSWVDPRVIARPSRIEGLGLFATASIAKGEVVGVVGGLTINDAELREIHRTRPKYNSLAVGDGINLLVDDDDVIVRGNHSCDSNLWMRDAVTLEARRAIAPDEELTVDYALLTALPEWAMSCDCRSSRCRRTVRGTDWRLPDVRGRYRDHFSPFLNARIAHDEFEAWLRGPSSYLAAVARHELPIGETARLHGHVIEALRDGFRVDGEVSGPREVEAGRYRLRLSHQNMPAVVVLDADAPREEVTPEWFPYDSAFRFVVPLERDVAQLSIGSTTERTRAATRAGWFRFEVDGVATRVLALRLDEPGVAADALEIYFTDATSGRESYRMRYLGVAAASDGGYVLDFNRAYNPACAYSPHYNCPIPPPENHLAIPIRAGERMPRRGGS
jgi:hypothetical protein